MWASIGIAGAVICYFPIAMLTHKVRISKLTSVHNRIENREVLKRESIIESFIERNIY